jgi:uncharacterized protein YozE (UPF0346 family)
MLPHLESSNVWCTPVLLTNAWKGTTPFLLTETVSVIEIQLRNHCLPISTYCLPDQPTPLLKGSWRLNPYQAWWFMPVILAAEVAEIGRIKVQDQWRQKVHETFYKILSSYLHKKCEFMFRLTLFGKHLKSQKAEGGAQVVQCLPSKCKALSSNPQYLKKKTMKYSM